MFKRGYFGLTFLIFSSHSDYFSLKNSEKLQKTLKRILKIFKKNQNSINKPDLYKVV